MPHIRSIRNIERKIRNRLVKLVFQTCPIFRSEYQRAIEFEQNDTDVFNRNTFYFIISNEIVNKFLNNDFHQYLVSNFLKRKIQKFGEKTKRLIRLSINGGDKLSLVNSRNILLQSVTSAYKNKLKLGQSQTEPDFSILKIKCHQKKKE